MNSLWDCAIFNVLYHINSISLIYVRLEFLHAHVNGYGIVSRLQTLKILNIKFETDFSMHVKCMHILSLAGIFGAKGCCQEEILFFHNLPSRFNVIVKFKPWSSEDES